MRQLELDIKDYTAPVKKGTFIPNPAGKKGAKAVFDSLCHLVGKQIPPAVDNELQPVQPNAAALRELLRQKWPEAGYIDQFDPRSCFRVQLAQLNTVFPAKGIPYGQLLEITGGISSGKTGLLLRTLAALTPAPRIVYVDCAGMFFPPAAVAAGIDPEQILLLRHEHIDEAIRGVELLLEAKLVNCVAFDLAGIHETLPRILLHRLRQQIVRARALAFFLTDDTAHLLPASLISLQLTVRKLNRQTLEVTATRSRINNEGAKGRLTLEAA